MLLLKPNLLHIETFFSRKEEKFIGVILYLFCHIGDIFEYALAITNIGSVRMHKTKFKIPSNLVLLLIITIPPSHVAIYELSFPFHRPDDLANTYHDENSSRGNFISGLYGR